MGSNVIMFRLFYGQLASQTVHIDSQPSRIAHFLGPEALENVIGVNRLTSGAHQDVQ